VDMEKLLLLDMIMDMKLDMPI
jgi:hypothetical protein